MSNEDRERKKLAAEEINRLAKMNGGRITPRQLVDEARDESSPLHHFFEWDDTTAAELYREQQARTLLRSVELQVKTETVSFDIPAFIRDPEADSAEQGYVATATLRSEEDLARDALIAEFQRVAANLTRARKLARFFGLEDEVDNLSRQVGMVRSRLEDSPPAGPPM